MAEVTELLLQWNSGDEEARHSLIDVIHDELQSIASRHLAGERHSIELQPDALVNEAYIRLVEIGLARGFVERHGAVADVEHVAGLGFVQS